MSVVEKMLAKLLDSTADAAFAVDDQGLICTWNAAAEKLFGYSPPEVVGKPCATLIQGRDSLGTMICNEPCSVLECSQRQQEIPNYDMEVRARSGRRTWVNVSILVFHDERTNRHLVAHLVREIGHRRKREDLTRRLVQVAKQIASLPEDNGSLAPVSPLTGQEQKVLRGLAEGKSPTAMAQDLGISPKTLRNHIHRVNQKLRTHNRLEAVMQAMRRGLI